MESLEGGWSRKICGLSQNQNCEDAMQRGSWRGEDKH
jgi:hypothetical protein